MKNSYMPAMPVMDESDYGQHYGLTKREHFAGLAMQGLMARDDFCMDEDVISKMALWSTQCADALLAELEK